MPEAEKFQQLFGWNSFAIWKARRITRAVEECDKLTKAFPAERPALMALLTAGRISLKNLNRPEDALRYYKAADASPVPHLDWEANIKAGMVNAEKALGAPVAQ